MANNKANIGGKGSTIVLKEEWLDSALRTMRIAYVPLKNDKEDYLAYVINETQEYSADADFEYRFLISACVFERTVSLILELGKAYEDSIENTREALGTAEANAQRGMKN